MEKPYIVIFGSEEWSDGKATFPYGYVLGEAETLEAARAMRVVGGDLVFDLRTRAIVESQEWLWEHEKIPPPAGQLAHYAALLLKSNATLADNFCCTHTGRVY